MRFLFQIIEDNAMRERQHSSGLVTSGELQKMRAPNYWEPPEVANGCNTFDTINLLE